jgi:hypothetical protein
VAEQVPTSDAEKLSNIVKVERKYVSSSVISSGNIQIKAKGNVLELGQAR